MSKKRKKQNRNRNQLAPLNPPNPRPPGVIAQLQRTEIEAFSGPLPPPDVLARYDQVLPGAAERILSMAERQSDHRQRLESMVVKGNTSAQTRGAWFAFVISLVAIGGGIWLIHEGRSATGLATIISDLVALAGVFVYTRKRQIKEREKKTQALEERRRR